MNNTDIIITSEKQITLSNCMPPPSSKETVAEIIKGITSKPRYIPTRFFYDGTGSALFEKITGLPEYYPTRTEKGILKENAAVIARDLADTDIVELGSGDCSKISILFDVIPPERRRTICYIPVDVSRSAILESAETLSRKYPEISIHGMLADFLKHLSNIPGKKRRVFCFFGSTIGNMDPAQTSHFISNLGSLMRKGDQLLLGFDMVKDTVVLENAYNDTWGVTAEFNKNILRVVSNLIITDIDPEHFDHVAFYNTRESRIEMHLKALKDIDVESPHLSAKITIGRGETIHTENSCKFTGPRISVLADEAGLRIDKVFTDDNHWFSVAHFLK